MGMDEFTNDDDFNLKEEVAALFELWDDPDFAVKVGPEVGPNADALTSLTRGRGPRRGNLEDLLKYWRPIMKKPGGFRRCVVILMDKPQFGGKPQRICAWLHHEITGKWPNEGNHHGRGKGKGKGKRRGSRTRSVRRAGRRLKTADIFESEIMFMPLDGSQEMVDLKAKRSVIPNTITTPRALGPVGTAATGAFSFALPGDLSDIRSPIRSAIFEALTPGPPGIGGRRGIGRRGGGARNKFRCPPGFQAGGTFTNSNFSTCGLRVLGVPAGGPGAFAPEIGPVIRELADDADLRRSVGDLRTNRNARAIIENSQIPAAPKEVAIGKRQASIDLIVSLIDAEPDLDLGRRFVRRDGVILDLVLPNNTLAGLGEFDDMNDGVIVLNENLRREGQIGQEIVPVMSTGLRAIVFHVPGQGTMSLRRVGGDMTDDERNGLAAAWAASLTSSQRRPDDPTAALRNFAENSGGRYTLDENIAAGGAGEDGETAFNRELIVVENPAGGKLTVPRWVYELYLSREAPRREEGETVYTLVEDATKMAELSRFSIVKQDVVPDATFDRHGWAEAAERVALFNEVKGAGGKAGRVIPDPSGKSRCPVGTAGGGQFTNANGTTCGARLIEALIDQMMDVGRSLRVPDNEIGKGSKRPKGVRTPVDNRVVDRLRGAGYELDEVFDSVDDANEVTRESIQAARDAGLEASSGLGATIGQAVPDRSVLSPDDAAVLEGEGVMDALYGIQEMVSSPDFERAGQPLRLEVFGRLEDLANVEAARRGVAASGDREIGRQREFDQVLGAALQAVAPGSGSGDSRAVDTARTARQFGGSEMLVDMPEGGGAPGLPDRDPSLSLDEMEEPSFEELLATEDFMSEDDLLGFLDVPEVSDFVEENIDDVEKFKKSAATLAVEQRRAADRDHRVAKVNAFLDAKYPEGVERPWLKWKDANLITMSDDDREQLIKDMWSVGVEFPGGEYTVKGPGGDKRVRMTITPFGNIDSSDNGDASHLALYASFMRKFYDAETGEYLGEQEAGVYKRILTSNSKTGDVKIDHAYMINDRKIAFKKKVPGTIDMEWLKGGSPTGVGLSKELNYRAYAFYEALSPNSKVELETAAHGPWVWPRQGINKLLTPGELNHNVSGTIDEAVKNFTSIPDATVFRTGKVSEKDSNFIDVLAQVVVAPTNQHRERLKELGVAFREGGFTPRDVQLAMENPVDGTDLDEQGRALISRSMMIDGPDLGTDLRVEFNSVGGRGDTKYTQAVISALDASGIEIDGVDPETWFQLLDTAEERNYIAHDILERLNEQFNDLGLSSGSAAISELIDTGIR